MQSTLARLVISSPISFGLQRHRKVEKHQFPTLRRKVAFGALPDAFCVRISMRVAETLSLACKARWHVWLYQALFLSACSAIGKSKNINFRHCGEKSHLALSLTHFACGSQCEWPKPCR